MGTILGLVFDHRFVISRFEDEYGFPIKIPKRIENVWEMESTELGCVWGVYFGGIDDAVLLGGVETRVGGGGIEDSC